MFGVLGNPARQAEHGALTLACYYELKDSSKPPSTPFPLSASSPGFVTHDMWIAWQRGPQTNVTLDMIRNAGPFSMDFYQQFVRDMYDKSDGAPWPLLRWTTAPSFYVRTLDQNFRPIEQKVLAITLDAIRRAVPAFTAGHDSAAAVETGTEERPGRPIGSTCSSCGIETRRAFADAPASAGIPGRLRFGKTFAIAEATRSPAR